MRRGVLVVPVGTLMGRLPPPEFLARHYSLSLKAGDRLDLDNMRQKSTRAGYRAVSQVTEHGIRGARVATGFVPNGSGYTDARRFVRR